MNHEQNQALIDQLIRCAIECNHCMISCLEEKDVKAMKRCIKLDIDCAEVCQVTASLLSRGSEVSEKMLAACAEICNACADECGKHSQMDHCKRCADVCRQCAEECSALV